MRRAVLTRRCASALLAAVAARQGFLLRPTHAIEVPVRSEQEMLGRQLYSTRPPPTSQTYGQQLSDAIPIKSDGFGRDPESKGGIIEMKALWKLKRRVPDSGGAGGGGAGGAGTFTYAGRIRVNRRAENSAAGTSRRTADASIEGEIIELIKGGQPKGGSERKVGTFSAELERDLTAAEDEASGTPEAMQMTVTGQ